MSWNSGNGLFYSESSRIPPFWVRPRDEQDQSVDPRARELAEELWPWAFRHVERQLRDGPSAAETLEEVVIAVSARLRAEPEVGRNLKGYLITAFHYRVRSRRIRQNRLALEGLAHELETNYKLRSPDTVAALDWQLTVDLLLTFLPHEVQHTLHLRLLGFSWKEISKVLRLSVKQAKSRYYYGLQRAYEDLMTNRLQRLVSEGGD
jgi:DNA-directed RNA polymerase specialized sigma24 family protein